MGLLDTEELVSIAELRTYTVNVESNIEHNGGINETQMMAVLKTTAYNFMRAIGYYNTILTIDVQSGVSDYMIPTIQEYDLETVTSVSRSGVPLMSTKHLTGVLEYDEYRLEANRTIRIQQQSTTGHTYRSLQSMISNVSSDLQRDRDNQEDLGRLELYVILKPMFKDFCKIPVSIFSDYGEILASKALLTISRPYRMGKGQNSRGNANLDIEIDSEYNNAVREARLRLLKNYGVQMLANTNTDERLGYIHSRGM